MGWCPEGRKARQGHAAGDKLGGWRGGAPGKGQIGGVTHRARSHFHLYFREEGALGGGL